MSLAEPICNRCKRPLFLKPGQGMIDPDGHRVHQKCDPRSPALVATDKDGHIKAIVRAHSAEDMIIFISDAEIQNWAVEAKLLSLLDTNRVIREMGL